MKHDNDTRRVNNPARERLATARKRTLRSASARAARSVWSECQSRVIESRNFDDSPGLPDRVRGGSTDMYAVRRGHGATRAMCMEAGPGSESGAEAYRGIRGSWESPRVLLTRSRRWTKPDEQRPGVPAKLTVAGASEQEREHQQSPLCEGNRSGREDARGSLSCLIVAIESRETKSGGSL